MPAGLVEVRRNARLLGAVAGLAGLTAAAYLARAVQDGTAVDWLIALGLGAVAAAYTIALLDARAPLLVADQHGVRVRIGRTWLGFPWSAVASVDYRPRAGMRDGRLVVRPEQTPVLGDLRGRIQLRLASALYGAPLGLPIGLSTRVTPDGDFAGTLERLAGDRLVVDEFAEAVDPQDALPDPEPISAIEVADQEPIAQAERLWRDPRPIVAAAIGRFAERVWAKDARPAVPGTAPATASALTAPAAPAAPASPLRQLRPAVRAEVRLDATDGAHALAPRADEVTVSLPEIEQLRRPELDDFSVLDQPEVAEPVTDPIVGPELAAARARLRLSVAELAERTRIRAHVIEAVEVDDFGSCGGDFYARGHIRTLARVLGVDAAPLVAAYDDRYAQAPVSARRIFEAELGSGSTGALHSTRSGTNWSVLVAAVMAVVLAWSVARLVVDGPVAKPTTPSLGAGSGGLGNPATAPGDRIAIVVRAAAGGAHVVVRDGKDRIVLQDDLAYGATRTVQALPPVRVDSSDGSLVVTIDGKDRGPLGETGQGATGTFVAPR